MTMRTRFPACPLVIAVLVLSLAGGARGQVDLGAPPSLGGMRFVAEATAEPVMSGEGTITIAYAVSYDELLFLKTDEGYRARFEVTAILYNEDGDQVTGDSWRREVRVAKYEETNSRRMTVKEELTLKALPGKYRLKVELNSLDTRSSGTIETMVEVPQISREGITLGPIVFEREAADTTGTLEPAREYGEDNPTLRIRVPVYAEPGTRYLFDASIETSEGIVQKSEADTLVQTTFLMKHERSFGVLDLEVGNYFIKIKVRVLDGGQKAVRRARFRVVNSPKSWGTDFDKMIAQISYVASREDLERLMNAPPELRQQAWDDFWRRNDPDPSTEQNEFKDEFLRRLGEANMRFRSTVEGWQTDMGRIYIQHGEPDDVDSQPIGKMLNAWETWYYYLEHTKYVFVDKDGFGEFKLVEVSSI
jgi:GWxTD domain-containing protein